MHCGYDGYRLASMYACTSIQYVTPSNAHILLLVKLRKEIEGDYDSVCLNHKRLPASTLFL
jgi:hypothetical protein